MLPAESRRVYGFGPFRLEKHERRLLRNGVPVPVRPKILDTLLLLVENRGHLLHRDELIRALWSDATVEETNLSHNISVLRKILGCETSYIETLPRRGYRFVAEVDELEETGAELTSSPGAASGEAASAVRPAACEASIAVLAFANISSEAGQELFCDGMAEEVINALTRVQGLRVVARTSSFQFKGRDLDVREIGARLGVATVLEGSVRRVGDRLRITAQLIQVSDGYHLWSGRFDRELADVFEIQDEIARAIAERLRVELVAELTAPLVSRPTENMVVYNFYMEALHHLRFETAESIERATVLLQRALESEPGLAPAWACLARCYPTLAGYGLLPIEEALPRAEEATARALELDGSLAETQLAVGTLRGSLHWDWRGAQRAFLRALAGNPGSSEAHHAYCTVFLAPVGRLEEAEREARIALDLDPLAPLRSRVLAQVLYWSRQYEAAVAQLEHTLELDPDFPLARQLLAAVYTSKGQPDDAVRERQRHLRGLDRSDAAEELGRVYEEHGEEGMLRLQIEKGLARIAAGEGHAYYLALLYALLDDKDEALAWFDVAFAHKGGLIVYAKVHPWLDSLRSDPRFADYLDRMGVNDPSVATPGAFV